MNSRSNGLEDTFAVLMADLTRTSIVLENMCWKLPENDHSKRNSTVTCSWTSEPNRHVCFRYIRQYRVNRACTNWWHSVPDPDTSSLLCWRCTMYISTSRTNRASDNPFLCTKSSRRVVRRYVSDMEQHVFPTVFSSRKFCSVLLPVPKNFARLAIMLNFRLFLTSMGIFRLSCS